MSEHSIKTVEGYAAFRDECTFFLCEEEYPGWTGEEKYGIVTDLTLSELKTRFPKVIAFMGSVVILPAAVQAVRKENYRQEKKKEMRKVRNDSAFPLDEETEFHFPESVSVDMTDAMLAELMVAHAMDVLNEEERRRVTDRYFRGLSVKQIGQNEKISDSAVCFSIRVALQKMRKYLG